MKNNKSIHFIITFASLLFLCSTTCMDLTLPEDILLQKIMPFLDLTATSSLRKSCKRYHEKITLPTFKSFSNKCNNLNSDDYLEALIYYTQENHKAIVKHLIKKAKNRGQKNYPITKALYELSGWSIDPFGEASSVIINTLGKILQDCKKENSKIAHCAVRKGNVTGLSIFFKLNNNPNIKDSAGKIPLHYIVCEKDETDEENYKEHEQKIVNLISSLQLLFAHPHIDIHIQDNEGNTPLHYAVNFKLVDYFLNAERINPNIKNNYGETPLFYALKHRGITIVKGFHDNIVEDNDYQFEQLLNYPKTDVNTHNNDGDTPLHYTFQHPRFKKTGGGRSGNHQIYYFPKLSYDNTPTQQLLAHLNINVNIQNNKGETPLHCAAQPTRFDEKDKERCIIPENLEDEINIQKIQLLLAHKDIIVDIKNNNGETPFDYAVKANNIKAIELLRPYVNSDNIPDSKTDHQDNTLLNPTIASNDNDIPDPLIEHSTIPESFFYKHKKIIILSTIAGTMSLVGFLIYFIKG